MATLARPVRKPAPNLIVDARAGTGKTFTLVEGVRRIITGKGTPGVKGSDEQEPVWDAMRADKIRPGRTGFCAFNTSIVEELSRRVPMGCETFTLHSLGNRICRNRLGSGPTPENHKISNILEAVVGKDARDLKRERPGFAEGIRALCNYARQNLTGWTEGEGWTPEAVTDEALDGLAGHYGVTFAKYAKKTIEQVEEEAYAAVRSILGICAERTDVIDFVDMLWLPVVHNAPSEGYGLLLVDEWQDMSTVQSVLARRNTDRLIVCGDPRQAIYGFAGSDAANMAKAEAVLGESARGVKKLPLTETRRCGQAIVQEAQKIVPDFRAHKDNPLGRVEYQWDKEFFATGAEIESEAALYEAAGLVGGEDVSKVVAEERDEELARLRELTPRVSDMVLSRTNAGLIETAFKLAKMGTPVAIMGRNLGGDLVQFVDGLGAWSVGQLETKLDEYRQEETEKLQARKNPPEDALEALNDKVSCVRLFCEGSKGVNDVKARIVQVFGQPKAKGDKQAEMERAEARAGNKVVLSSVHRAKGLEAKRVFIVKPEKLPLPMRSKWQMDQEYNLKYVAQTRAIESLAYVQTTKKGS